MNYTEVLLSIKKASLFDLYRLNVAIQNELANPTRIQDIRNAFQIGDSVSYFDAKLNKLVQGKVIQKNPKLVVVESSIDQKSWAIPYYFLNLEKVDVDIRISNKEKLTKNNLKIGDSVGFNKDGRMIVGKVISLNFKTLTLLTPDNYRWRVSYNILFRFIDVERELITH